MPSQPTNNHTNHESSGSREPPLTSANLAAHDNRMSAAPEGPTPMQRWYTSTEDRVVQGRAARWWEELVDRDALATEIERIVQEVSKGKGEKWYVVLSVADVHGIGS